MKKILKESLVLLLAVIFGIVILPYHNQFSNGTLAPPQITSIFKTEPPQKKPSKPKPTKPKPKPVVAAPAPAPTPAPTPKPVATPSRTYTYCVAAKGVDEGNMPEFRAKLASVYADPRGWSLGGTNSFAEVASGCNFTVWLSAAELMPSFGAICDSTWSCAVTPNVVINFDRWRLGSDAWNATGSSLDDYRNMVINHETGHWFGFYHRYCSGSGQPAPVMQQQSIGMQGCTPNPWPLAHEKAAL
ncbi:MAG: DUF3152 domain-containing protein [Patescibacteria group bacterium]